MEQAALVLEGGGMRGIYTAGVLDCFLEEDLFFAQVYGVSAGACHACSYLSRQRGRALDISVNYLHDERYCGTRSLIKTGDLFGVEMSYDIIPNQLNRYDYQAYAENESKLTAVLTNCVSGEAEYYRVEDMREGLIAVRASASLPLLSHKVELDGKWFLDGGVADSIPLHKAIEDGFEKNIVVLTQHEGYRKSKNKLMPMVRLRYRKFPKFVEQMANRHTRYNRTIAYVKQQEQAGRAFVLRPARPLEIGRIEKDEQKLRAVYQLGYEDAKKNLSRLRAYLRSIEPSKE